ncbi:MAG TPA: extracellular solute-binding protein [Kofleriaceae bacterium]|jgi:arabinogalactan oligomer/maltooligosaccharide transport system substrate-binding protein
MRCVLAFLIALAACRDAHGIVLWHAYNGAERDALEATVTAWNAEHADEPITLVAVPYDAFADKLSSAIPRGNGPDLFIYPQDRIGDWADAGVIEPIEFWVDDARADRFTPASLDAMAYKGSLWGLPMAVKALALYYNPQLVPEPPRTTDDVLALAQREQPHGVFALAYPNVDLYEHAPWLHGFGGSIFDKTGAFAIATPEAAKAMAFARSLVTAGATPEDAQASLIASLFNEGRAATVISGPWFMGEIANVPWKVTTLPIVSATGEPARPFASAEGVMMSSRAHDKDAAFAAMEYLTNDASATTRAKRARQVVPNVHAWDDPALAHDDVLTAFRTQLDHVVAMPNDPRMRSVWTPYRTALGEVVSGRAEPGPMLDKIQHEIEGFQRAP